MKTLTSLLLIVFVLGAKGYLIKVPTAPMVEPSAAAPLGWMYLQKLLLPLFENVCEVSRDPTIEKLSQDFQQDMTNGFYQKPDVITNLQNLISKGLLPKGEIFTEYNVDHEYELKIIYELLYFANDFNTFYRAACWARQNVNCGLFVDALYSTIIHRRDMEKIALPAPYEILPNYFIQKDFIVKASSLIAGDDDQTCDWIRNDGNAYILDVNYTSNVYDGTDESKLVYFYEDIGLNSYYYLTKLKMLPWINTKPKGRYGEYLYYQIKQLMARYNLERYSNGLQEVEGINWDYLNIVPYNPMLVYSDGNDFSQRKLTQLESNEKLVFLKNIENNLATVVTHMREGGFNKSDILNHLMEILLTSEKSYQNIALQILNEDNLINNRPPSALGHYMTTLRDPAFWALNKKMVDIVDNALKVLPGYTKNELYFPGVEVLNIEVKKMMTSVDNFVFDVTDALKTSENDIKFKVKISQSRMNHKPFSVKVNITSLVTQKGLMKIYLGPKVKPGEHALKKNLFMLLDSSEINLKFGNNIITRLSMDMINNSDDLMSLYTIRKKLADAEFGLDSFTVKTVYDQITFPARLVLPKGSAGSLALQLFVFVVPFGKNNGNIINQVDKRNLILSPGFPLDLGVEVRELFDLPNTLVKDIVVIHKDEDQTTNYGVRSGPRSWQNNDGETPDENVVLPLGSRPAFTLRKQPYDYKSKQGQYGKKGDYAARRDNYKYKKDRAPVVDEAFKTDDDKFTINPEPITENSKTFIPVDTVILNEDTFGYLVSADTFDQGNKFVHDTKSIDTINNIKNNFANDKTEEDSKEKSSSSENSDESIIIGVKFGDNTVPIRLDDEKIQKDSNEDVHIDVSKYKNINQEIAVQMFNEDMYKPIEHNIIFSKTIDSKIMTDKWFHNSNDDKTIQDTSNTENDKVDVTSEENIGKVISSEDTQSNFYKEINKKRVLDVTVDEKIIPQKALEENDDVIYKKIDKKEIVDISKTIAPVNSPYKVTKPIPTIYDVVLNPIDNSYGSDEKVYE